MLKTFSAGLPGSADLAAARTVAEHLGTDHHEFVYSADEAGEQLHEELLETIRGLRPMSCTASVSHAWGVNNEPGRLEVIAGPMFAGKTEELLRRVRRAVIAGRNVQVFTHAIDDRGGRGRVASHAGLDYPSLGASSASEVEQAVRSDIDMVAIDEAHFFGKDLAGVVTRLAARGLVVVAGLDVTFDGLPFEPLPALMALAERVDKLTAICTVCGAEAVYHTRVHPAQAEATDPVAEHVGGAEKYQARCRRHFSP